MEDKTLVLKLELQIAQAKASVKQLQKEISDMDKRTLEAKSKMAQLAVQTERVGNLKTKIKGLKDEVGGLSKGMTGASAATGSASASVLEMGRVISDSNYGIRGVANNLSQLASNMVYTTKAAGGLGAGLKAIGSAMMGPLGILLLFQGAIALLEKWSMRAETATEETQGLNEAMGGAASNLKILKDSLEQGVLTQEEANDAIKAANEEYKDLNLVLDDNNKLTDDSVIAIEAQILSLGKLAKALALQKLLQDAYSKLLPLEIKQTELVTKAKLAEARAVNALSQSYREAGTATAESSARSARNAVEEGQKAIDELKKDISELLGIAGEEGLVSELFKGTKKKGGDKTPKRDKERSVGILTSEEVESARLKQAEQIDKLFQDKFSLEEENAQYFIDLNKRVGEQIANDSRIQNALRTEQEKEDAKNRIYFAKLEMERKLMFLDAIGGGLQAMSEIAGEETSVGKALAVAGATIDTYAAIAGQLAAFKGVPIPGYAIAQAIATGAFGFAQIKKILEVNVPNGRGGGGGSTPSAPSRTFDFNLVGSTGQNQLAQTIGGQVGQTIKAYVVGSEITNQQQFDNQIQGEVTIG